VHYLEGMSSSGKRRPSTPLDLNDGYRLPDTLWARMEPQLPPHPRHPLGYHNPRTPDRQAMDAILFVLRTGGQR